MNIREAWTYGRSALIPISSTPHLDARLLLQHVLGVGHTYLIAHDDEELTAVQQQTFQTLIQRAANHEPIPYLTGHIDFFGLEFTVSPAVLIPRPETEQLVEKVIEWAKKRPSAHIVDVGTGSGCIPISLATQLPRATVEAVDISTDALAIAQQNAAQHVAEQIQFHHGSLLEPIQSPIDLITANLPYITDDEWTMLDDAVKLHEPSIALKGGIDGFDLIRDCLQQATQKLADGGAIFLEIGWQQGVAAVQIAKEFFPTAVIELLPDYAGHDRFVTIQT